MSQHTPTPRPGRRAPLDPEQLRSKRIAAGLNQKQLADKAELSPQVVSKYELGTVGASADAVSRLARALGIEVAELLMPPEQVSA